MVCRRIIIICLIVLMSLSFVGCKVGPDYERPETAATLSSGYYNLDPDSDANQAGDIDDWWVSFGDEATSRLVRRALANNYDLKSAAARVLAAQADLAESTGKKLPEITTSFSRTMRRSDTGAPGAGIPDTGITKSRTYEHKFTVSYVLDIFGKLKRGEQQSWDKLLSQEYNRQALVNSVIATVIKSRVTIATLVKQLEIARANSKSFADTLESVERRYEGGLVSPVDVYLARENLASAQSQEPSLELQVSKAYHSLDVLLGAAAGSSAKLPDTLAEIPDFKPVDVGLPAKLLDRRPDIKAGEYTLRAANENIGIRVAELYPDLTLTASLGWSSGRSGNIYTDPAWVYSTVFSAVQPIFKGGQLRARVDSAKARFEELVNDYASTILTAMKEVEDALVSEVKLRQQLEHSRYRFEQAKLAENLARGRYERGVNKILLLLETERRRSNAENRLAILKGQLWFSRIDLLLALGGNWSNEEIFKVEGK
ncbi:MAG: efflux transporter outer membrane subunit [Planctomycetes bacterium]|nr:efflux transporter outer membrane subunit [Planctomycetota bacterium]